MPCHCRWSQMYQSRAVSLSVLKFVYLLCDIILLRIYSLGHSLVILPETFPSRISLKRVSYVKTGVQIILIS